MPYKIKKMKLLNRKYKIFQDNWLYLFAGSSMIREADIVNIKNKEIESYQIQFNKIFINCFDRIHTLENYELIQTIFLSDEKLTQINKAVFERAKKPK